MDPLRPLRQDMLAPVPTATSMRLDRLLVVDMIQDVVAGQYQWTVRDEIPLSSSDH